MPKPNRRKVRHTLIRAQDAARIVGVSRPTILAMVARGELHGESVGGLLFVSREDAEVAREKRAAKAAESGDLAVA